MGGQLSGTDELKEFLASMNQFHQNVKFTMELGGHKINFLDLTVSLYTRNCISTPCFEIFCKNTFTDVSIHNDSYHLRQHKMAVLHAAIHRLLSIPLDREAHEHEIRLIEEVGKINVLKVNVRELIRRKSVRKLLPENRDNPPKENRRKWVRLPYLWKTFDKIGKELNCLNYRTAFYPVSEVAQLLTIKDAVLENQKAGIYEFRCGECKAIYIGQIGKKLSTRVKEHVDAANAQKPEKFALAKHCTDSAHDIKKAFARLWHTTIKGRLMNRRLEEVEAITEAVRPDNNLLNDLQAIYVSPIASYYFHYLPQHLA